MHCLHFGKWVTCYSLGARRRIIGGMANGGVRQLRDYQRDAYDSVWREWKCGRNRTVVVHATGLGKTDVIAKLCVDEAASGGIALVLAERSEPLDQFTKRVAQYASIPVGRVQADRNEIGERILAASVQTLRNPARMATCPRPTLLVIDECHHALAESYRRVMQWAGCFEPSGTRMVGFTATLVRGDGQGFGDLFESVADVKGIDWAIDHGRLVEPVGRVVRLGRSLDWIPRVAGDLAAAGAGDVVRLDAGEIVDAWLTEADNRITVAFVATVEAAEALTAEFVTAGVAAELVVGTTPHDDRTGIYGRLAAGVTRVVVNVGVLTEAWDCPEVSCVLAARMTTNPGLYEQMVGRGLRLCAGKSDCLVLDVVGVSRKFKLVTLVDMRGARFRPAAPKRCAGRGPRGRGWWARRPRFEGVGLRGRRGWLARLFG